MGLIDWFKAKFFGDDSYEISQPAMSQVSVVPTQTVETVKPAEKPKPKPRLSKKEKLDIEEKDLRRKLKANEKKQKALERRERDKRIYGVTAMMLPVFDELHGDRPDGDGLTDYNIACAFRVTLMAMRKHASENNKQYLERLEKLKESLAIKEYIEEERALYSIENADLNSEEVEMTVLRVMMGNRVVGEEDGQLPAAALAAIEPPKQRRRRKRTIAAGDAGTGSPESVTEGSAAAPSLPSSPAS